MRPDVSFFAALASLVLGSTARAQDAPGPMPGIERATRNLPTLSKQLQPTCPTPNAIIHPAIIPFDPTAPVSPPGPLPSASRPSLDVVGATASFGTNGTKGTLVFAPFALFSDQYTPVLSEARIELRTGFGDTQSFGGSLSLGYSTASQLSTEQMHSLQQFVSTTACKQLKERHERLVETVEQFARFLTSVATTKQCAASAHAEPTDYRGADLVNCFRRHRNEMSDAEKREGDALAEAFLAKAEESLSELEDGWLKVVRAKRLELVFTNAVVASVNASLDAFPMVRGPDVSDNGATRKPIPNEFNSFAATLSLAYFFNERVGLWLTGGAEEKRPKPNDALSTRFISSLEGAWNIPVGEADENGFRPGTALGLSTRWSTCRETAGCKESILAYPDSIATEDALAGIPFFDVRLSSSLEFRFAVPVTYYRLTDPSPGGEDNIVTVIPTLSSSVSKWKTEVN